MSTIVRDALPSDADALIALSRRTIRASYGAFLGRDAVRAYLESGAADRYVEESIGRCVVILRGEEIVGYAVWREELIDLMMIDHAVHRQGLGTILLRQVEAALFRTHEELRLESFEANESANAFYVKNGWRERSRYFDRASGGNKIVYGKGPSRAHGGGRAVGRAASRESIE
ncbi:MAG: GNAT family N-acetyltransferase [Planctomycetota bacterium]|jgi:GNAT superfamily N-acetyltransferase